MMSTADVSSTNLASSPKEVWVGARHTQNRMRSLRIITSGLGLVLISAAIGSLIGGMQRQDSFFFFLAGALGGFGLGALLAAQTSGRETDSEVSELLVRIVTDLSQVSEDQEVSPVQEMDSLSLSASRPKFLEPGGLDWEYLLARDPQLALAKVRIDLETALNELRPITERSQFVSPAQLVRRLLVEEFIDSSMAGALEDVLRVCNYAVHGRFVPTVDDARSTLELAQRLLARLSSLQNKSREERSNMGSDELTGANSD